MVKFTFGMDINGNKIVKVSSKGARGFSVQTNANLPQTHKMGKSNMNLQIILNELQAFCGYHGTTRQQNILAK